MESNIAALMFRQHAQAGERCTAQRISQRRDMHAVLRPAVRNRPWIDA